MTFIELMKNFFTHKDWLPSADQIPGTLFTPLHIVFAIIIAFVVIFGAMYLAKRSETTVRRVFAGVWATTVILEIVKIIWETYSGASVKVEWAGILPLYPCSLFMYAMPFAIWGKGKVRYAACGYLCTLGLLGGTINFVYPANILGNYSCLSFAGFHTFFFHGAIVFSALYMLFSGYHSYKNVTKWWELMIPAIPCLLMSIVAHIVNFSPIGSDYMFFKLNSFFLAPLGAMMSDWQTVIVVYLAYFIIHALPYIPFYVRNYRKESK